MAFIIPWASEKQKIDIFDPVFLWNNAWVKVFRIISEFRIFLNPKSWIRQTKIASLIYSQYVIKQLNILTWNCHCFVVLLHVLSFEFRKFRIFEILNFHPWQCHINSFIDRKPAVLIWNQRQCANTAAQGKYCNSGIFLQFWEGALG